MQDLQLLKSALPLIKPCSLQPDLCVEYYLFYHKDTEVKVQLYNELRTSTAHSSGKGKDGHNWVDLEMNFAFLSIQ